MNARTPRMWSVALSTLALLALTVGSATAATRPSLAYQFSSHPMISGTVVRVNDHQMIVDTDQGEQVTLDVDSRTMAPRDLAPGMVMRAEFLALEDCHFYAQRIVPLRSGLSANRQQAYANTHDSEEVIARNATSSGVYNREVSASQVSTNGRETAPQTIGEHSPGANMTATPTTADYVFSTRPMMSGRVVSVNDHQLIVDTDQGQRVGLVMDSRTMVPSEVAPGSVVRAEFRPMNDGRFFATRIAQTSSGIADREQAYTHTRDSDLALAQNTTDCGCANTVTHSTTMSSVIERHDTDVKPVAVVADPVPEPVVETLPQTASSQPLILLLGLLALGGAGAIMVARTRRTA